MLRFYDEVASWGEVIWQRGGLWSNDNKLGGTLARPVGPDSSLCPCIFRDKDVPFFYTSYVRILCPASGEKGKGKWEWPSCCCHFLKSQGEIFWGWHVLNPIRGQLRLFPSQEDLLRVFYFSVKTRNWSLVTYRHHHSHAIVMLCLLMGWQPYNKE
jgi:hypothetical protein